MRYTLFGIGTLGIIAALQASGVVTAGHAHAGSAPVVCARGGTGQLTVQTPSVILAGAPGTTPFQVRLDLEGVGAARPVIPGEDILDIPAQISGRVTFSLKPGKRFEDYDNRAAAATAEWAAPLQGTAAGGRAFLHGSGHLDTGTWKAVPGAYRLHATNLALTLPGAGPCHVSDIGPLGEFFVQPPATAWDDDPASSRLVAAIRSIMFMLVVAGVGVFLYANRPERFRRGRKPRTAGPGAPRHERARAPRALPEPAGFESRPHLRLFRTFTSIAGGCLLTLGLVVSCAIDRRITLGDLPGLPGRPSPPVPDRAWPTAIPSQAGARPGPPPLPGR
ncbi:hypothetical protein ABZW49_42935 [Nonomuraea wenchangensis]